MSNTEEPAYQFIVDIQGRITHREMINTSGSVQKITISLPGNSSGNIVVVRLNGPQKSDKRKIRIS